MRRRAPVALGLWASLALLPTPAWTETPLEELRAAAEKVIRILDDPALTPEDKAPERQAAVRAAVVDLIDFTEISRRALARHWRQLNEAERQDFVVLFRTLLERTYLPQIKLYQGERIRFVGESVDGDFASVQARVVTRRDLELGAIFRLHRVEERWLIYDVSVEGIGLVANYRSQFDRIIRRVSYHGLLRRLAQKVATSDVLPASAARE